MMQHLLATIHECDQTMTNQQPLSKDRRCWNGFRWEIRQHTNMWLIWDRGSQKPAS